jgi:alpha-ketoglutarate-dependent taurine dioxygenase
MTISITPINDQMGASITGITGAEAATPEVARQLQGALDEYGVVVLPELNISDDDLAALARLLGEVVLPPYGALADHPEISPVTRDPALDKLARYREANVNWHIDGTTSDAPDKMTLLTARRTAENGEGNTEFANTYAAYRALPDDDKALIDDLRVRFSADSAYRKVDPNPTEKQVAQWATVPKSEHPLVWKRQDGRRSLVMGSTAEAVIDMPDDEGQALLRRLLDWATQPEFTLSHSWREGDLVIFDNTGLLHRAMPYSATSPRLMHRATIAGDEAFG